MKSVFKGVVRVYHLIITCLVLGYVAPAFSQTMVEGNDKCVVIDSITRGWEPWTTMVLSGKFKMAGLPVTPSVKIYMERDSSILLSLRAPFVGEVGRAEIADSTIIVVNKMNKTYVEEPLEKVLAYYPGGVSDIQELLLGHAVMPGLGSLSNDFVDSLEIYREEDGSCTVITTDDARIEGFNYGYSFNPQLLLTALMVLPLSNPDAAITLSYEFYPKGYDIEFVYQSEKKNYRALLELDSPDPDGKGFDRIKIGNKFTRVPFDKFVKSF